MTCVLTLPGWYGSEPEHWQTQWERLDRRIRRVDQTDWDRPLLSSWRARLRAALTGEPTVLVGHSLGALLAVHGAADAPGVVGALLVAPPDLDAPASPPELRSFAPVPMEQLPFPAVVVASGDDPSCALARSHQFAHAWGARVVEVTRGGHLNAASGLGTWPAGRTLLRDLCTAAPFSLDATLAADSHLVGESALSLLLLKDDGRYPWFIIVPKRSAVTEAFELSPDDQRQLAVESNQLAEAMCAAFQPDKMNVGALGNIVRQLHVHCVARTLGDPAWPGPVWGHTPAVRRTDVERTAVARKVLERLPGFAPRGDDAS